VTDTQRGRASDRPGHGASVAQPACCRKSTKGPRAEGRGGLPRPSALLPSSALSPCNLTHLQAFGAVKQSSETWLPTGRRADERRGVATAPIRV
jgi:hypothetical protein